VGLPVQADPGALIQVLLHMAISAKRDVGLGEGDQAPQTKWKMAELFADERCSGPILEFLRTTDVGRMVPPPKADTESEASAAEPE